MNMSTFASEIAEIPEVAHRCLSANKGLRLPRGLPCLGMGSSLYAGQAARYAGADLWPEAAAEFALHVSPDQVFERGILISQSGRSSETVWCRKRFREHIAITNDITSPLAEGASLVVDLRAGPEQASASKTYIATLVALLNGVGLDPASEVAVLGEGQDWARDAGQAIADFVAGAASDSIKGMLVIGSGAALGSARQAALVLSECIKYPVPGCSVGDYDHGPKEAAAGSALIFILSGGPEEERMLKLVQLVKSAGASVHVVKVPATHDRLAAIPAILPFNFAALELISRLGISQTFVLGRKITEV